VLSERQRQILDFIGAYAERHGVSPSFKEIGDAVGLKAISAVKYQVEQLQEKGCLTRRGPDAAHDRGETPAPAEHLAGV